LRLYEYEGKALLAQHGVAVPRGAVWPELPDTAGPLVVKAQILGGGRGKQGGIRFVSGTKTCSAEVKALMGSRLGEQTVEKVYVEERLAIERELYVAITVDRERWSTLLLASARGGVDIDDVPDDEMTRLSIDPSLGLRPFALRHVTGRLGLTGDVATRVAATIRGAYDAFSIAEAELVEINPLVVTADGRVVAADAKVVLDDAATFRHPERPTEPREGTAFERECASRGTVGVEMDGDVATIVSGAGLMMATIDLLGAAGVRLRAAVDLGGTAFGSPALPDVVRAVIDLSPKVILINAFFNLAFCDVLARGIAEGFRGRSYQGRVVVRLRGRNLLEAKAILRPLGFTLFDDLPGAIECTVGHSTGVSASQS
jgi:succinyl-CoA synthetase beta subunit